MNHTFRYVAAYCGLRLSYYTALALLTLIFLILIPTPYRSASPLYILLTAALLPSVLHALLFSKEKTEKKEYAFAYPLFCKKYHYDPDKHKAFRLSYLLLFVLLTAWQLSYSMNESAPPVITRLPLFLAAFILLIRILGLIGYRLYFHFFPIKAMH